MVLLEVLGSTVPGRAKNSKDTPKKTVIIIFHGSCFAFNLRKQQDRGAMACSRFIGYKEKHTCHVQTLELFVHRIEFIYGSQKLHRIDIIIDYN